MNKKRIAVLMAVVLMIGVASGATLAWLKAGTDPVTNVFTVGDINIALDETKQKELDGTRQFHFVPGDELAKDPKVTVTKGSEDAYVFVRVTVENNEFTATLEDGTTAQKPIIDWAFANDFGGKVYEAVENGGAYALEEVTFTEAEKMGGTYYLYTKFVKDDNLVEDKVYQILAGGTGKDVFDCNLEDGKVNLSPYVTKEDVTALHNAKPTLSFNAAAVQARNLEQGSGDTLDISKVIAELPERFMVVNP